MITWLGWDDEHGAKGLCAYFLEREWANLYLASLFYQAQSHHHLRTFFALGYDELGELRAVVALDGDGRLLVDARQGVDAFNIKQLFAFFLREWAQPYCLIGSPDLIQQLTMLYERSKAFICVDYLLMRRMHSSPYPLWQLPEGMEFKPSTVADFDKLLGLEIAYQKEEVMVSTRHVMNQRAMALHFRQRLRLERGFHLEYADQGLAKLSINISGRHYQQISGVYTHVRLRGKGVAKLLFSNFLHHYQQRNQQHLSLFVKQQNIAARGLYKCFNFHESAGFRISYL